MKYNLVNEVFALRRGERVEIVTKKDYDPEDGSIWLAVQLLPVVSPAGGLCTISEGYTIFAAMLFENGWGWVHLTPPTKSFIGNMLLGAKAQEGLWYYARIEKAPLPQRQDGLTAQLKDCIKLATKYGLYDAADYLKGFFT